MIRHVEVHHQKNQRWDCSESRLLARVALPVALRVGIGVVVEKRIFDTGEPHVLNSPQGCFPLKTLKVELDGLPSTIN